MVMMVEIMGLVHISEEYQIGKGFYNVKKKPQSIKKKTHSNVTYKSLSSYWNLDFRILQGNIIASITNCRHLCSAYFCLQLSMTKLLHHSQFLW